MSDLLVCDDDIGIKILLDTKIFLLIAKHRSSHPPTHDQICNLVIFLQSHEATISLDHKQVVNK